VLQAFNGTASLGTEAVTGQHIGGIAWWAHVGGFVAGLLLTPCSLPNRENLNEHVPRETMTRQK